jgi:hypothetical protein
MASKMRPRVISVLGGEVWIKCPKVIFLFERTSFFLHGKNFGPCFKHHLTPTIMAKQSAEESAQEKLQDARKRNLDLAISQIQKEFGEAAIMRLGDESRCDVDVIPTGNLLIDRALGDRRSLRSGIIW